MLKRSQLHNYQVHGVETVVKNDKYYLGLAMGLGKTATALTAVVDLIDAMEVRKVLVVAPLRVAIDTWPGEIAKWEHLAHLRIASMVGTPKEREAALKSNADVYIINVDNLVWLETFIGRGQFPFDMLILDEGTNYKNRDAKRCRTAMRMSRVVPRLIILSATPAPNGYLDLWAQYYILDQGARLFPQYTRYQNTYFKLLNLIKFKLRRGADTVIQGRIADITLTMRAEDYLDIPEKTVLTVPVTLSQHALEAYEEFEKNLVFELGDVGIVSFNAATTMGKLTQFANGLVYDENKVAHEVHRDKLDALLEMVKENLGEPVIIAYAFTSDRDRIMAALPNAIALDKNPDTIARWNRGEIPILLTHPASAGHGLNLQFSGRRIFWYGPTYNLEHWIQMNGRLHRQGQALPVFIHVLIAKGTIDETIMKVLEGKNMAQEALLNALKHRVNKIKKILDTV